MFCKNCGAQIAEGKKFCPNCGSPIGNSSVDNANASSNTNPNPIQTNQSQIKSENIKTPPKPQKAKNSSIGVIIPIILIVAMAGGAFALFKFGIIQLPIKGSVASEPENQIVTGWVGDKYFDGNGNQVFSEWVGDYYIGGDGNKVRDHWIDDYYVGSDGKAKYNSWVGDFWVGYDGKIVKNSWVDGNQYYVGQDGRYLTNQYTPDNEYVGADGKKVDKNSQAYKNFIALQEEMKRKATSVPATQVPTQAYVPSTQGYTQPANNGNNGGELYISETLKLTDSVDDANYTCKITLSKPVILGADLDEVYNINEILSECIDEMMESIYSYAEKYSPVPKTITFNTPTVTTLSTKRFRITFSGKINPREGSNKTLKFRFDFDREDQSGSWEDLSN